MAKVECVRGARQWDKVMVSQGTVENLQALLTYVVSTPCQPLGWWAKSSCLLVLPGSSPEMETLNTVLTQAFPPSSYKAIVFTP